jgi:hypothetical protein
MAYPPIFPAAPTSYDPGPGKESTPIFFFPSLGDVASLLLSVGFLWAFDVAQSVAGAALRVTL